MVNDVQRDRGMSIAVFGSADVLSDTETYQQAFDLGGRIAENGWTVVTGGYGGVMGAASHGAHRKGGFVIGVTLMDFDPKPANQFISLRHHEQDLFGRASRLIKESDAIVILDGGLGTLAEFGLAWVLKQVRLLPEDMPILILSPSFKRIQLEVVNQLGLSKRDVEIVHHLQSVDQVINYLNAVLPSSSPPIAPVTITIAAYNAEDYIEASINSAMQQTVSPAAIIVVDDGSTDKTAERVSKMQSLGSGLYLIRQKNSGTPAALNTAIASCKSKYILGLDADDLLEPNALELLWNAAEENPHAALVYSDYRFIDSDSFVIKEVKNPDPGNAIELLIHLHDRLGQPEIDNFLPFGHARLYRTDCLRSLGGYAVDMLYSEDFDLVLRAAERWPFVHVPEFLYQYRWHDKNKGIIHRDGQIADVREAIRRHRWRRGSQ